MCYIRPGEAGGAIANGMAALLWRDCTVNRALLIGAAGAMAIAEGFAKTIPPLIELGVALVIIALITKPKTNS